MVSAERELSIRARVAAVYNRPEADFASRGEYDDYLEKAEDVVFALISDDPAEQREAEQKLRSYKQENREAIAIFAARKAEESRLALEREREAAEAAAAKRCSGASDMHTPTAARGVLAGAPATLAVGEGSGQQHGGRTKPMLYTPAMAANPMAPLVQPTPIDKSLQNANGGSAVWDGEDAQRRKAAMRASGWSQDICVQRARQELLGLLVV